MTIFGLGRNLLPGDRRELHDEKLHSFYSSFNNVIDQNKQTEMCQTCSIHVGNENMHTKFWLINLMGVFYFKRTVVNWVYTGNIF